MSRDTDMSRVLRLLETQRASLEERVDTLEAATAVVVKAALSDPQVIAALSHRSKAEWDLLAGLLEKEHATVPLSKQLKLETLALLRATMALAESRSSRQVQLPGAAQFVLILLSRQRRDDVLNDLCDWAEQDGRFNAKCWLKLIAAFFGQVLDVLYRIGEVVGKFRGAK